MYIQYIDKFLNVTALCNQQIKSKIIPTAANKI